MTSLRQVVHDVPNLGGPYEPSLPKLRDVTAQVMQRQRRRQLAIADHPRGVESSQVERFDIFTPSEVTHDEGADEESAEVMPEGTEQLFSRYASRAPQVISDEAPESAFVFDVAELDAEKPSISFNICSARYLSMNRARVEHDEMLVFEYGTDEAVIERTHNILSRQEALANAEHCRSSMLKELARVGIDMAHGAVCLGLNAEIFCLAVGF